MSFLFKYIGLLGLRGSIVLGFRVGVCRVLGLVEGSDSLGRMGSLLFRLGGLDSCWSLVFFESLLPQ